MPDPNSQICPCCGQPLAYVRAGVRLPPMKAAIFDLIKQAGDPGVTSTEIMSSIYQQRSQPSINAVKSHIWQINDLLKDVGVIIRSERCGAAYYWRLDRL